MVNGNVVALRPKDPPRTRAPCSGTSFAWLRSPFPARVWKVADGPLVRTAVPGEERTATIDFGFILPDGSSLMDPENSEWLMLARRYAVLLREHEQSQIQSAQLHAQQVRYLFLLISWMRLQQEPIDHVEDLRKDDVGRFVLAAKHGTASVLDVPARVAKLAATGFDIDNLGAVRKALHLPVTADIKDEVAVAAGRSNGADRKPLVHNPIFRQLLVLEHLWAFRREIDGDNIRFDPFETSASAEAAKHCSDTGRTPVIPHRQAMTLIDGCIRLLVDVGPVVLALRRGLDAAAATSKRDHANRRATFLASEADAVESLRIRIRSRPEADAARIVEGATVLVVQACFTLIAALSARRHDEVATLRTNCILGGDGSRFVFSAILKTERENQHTPVPDLVSRAVDWLTELGEPARRASGGTRLFAWTDATAYLAGPRVRTVIPSNLEHLAEVCGVPPHEGERWRFTARQFRRFFAILYMWRHQSPDLGALRHHLRHWDFARTRAYCTDQSLGRIFTEEQRTFTRTIVTEAMAGLRQVGGAAGTRLMSMLSRLKGKYAGVVAMEPERIATWAERISDRMVIKCNPWSYCTCPDTRRGARDANCRSGTDADATGADLANATPETCIGCRHRMTDGIFTPFMRTELAQGERALRSKGAAGTVFAVATARRLDVIRTHIAAADAAGTPP